MVKIRGKNILNFDIIFSTSLNSAHYYLAHHYAAQYPFLNFPEKYQINSAQTSFSSPGRFWPGPLNGTAFPPGPQAHKPGPGPGIYCAGRPPAGPLRPRDARAVGWNPTAVVASTPHKTAVRPRPPQTLGHSLPPSLYLSSPRGGSSEGAKRAARDGGERRGAPRRRRERERHRPSSACRSCVPQMRARGSVERCSTVP